jgi:hypothetical protein
VTLRQPAKNAAGRVTAKRDLLAYAWEEYRAGRGGYDGVIYAEVALAAAEQERRDNRERRKR